nr:hypothetical protein CFP56_65014 [Quercus suber]
MLLKQTTTKHGALSLKPEEKVFVLLRCFYREHKEIVNRNSLYLTRLREAIGEVEALCQENSLLQVVNHELNKQLSLLIHALLRSSATSNDFTIAASFSALDAAFRRLRIGGVEGGMNEGSDHDHDQIPWDDVAAVFVTVSPGVMDEVV